MTMAIILGAIAVKNGTMPAPRINDVQAPNGPINPKSARKRKALLRCTPDLTSMLTKAKATGI